MSKEEYLARLQQALAENSISGADQMIEFYGEMIDDRMEEGMTEEEAVASMENVYTVAEQAKIDQPITTLVTTKVRKSHEKAKKEGRGTLWTVLVIIGSPVWVPLLAAFFIILLSLYVAMWAIVAALFVVEIALGASAVACFIGGFTVLFGWIPFATTIAAWGCALILGGLCILLWKPVRRLAVWLAHLIKDISWKIKRVFAK